MKVYETSKFKRLREKLRSDLEKEALNKAIREIAENPFDSKKLKGEFKDLRRHKYSAQGQERRLIFKAEGNTIYLLSFGPREGIYK
ncbi:MAG: type II toxin-antitoxin system RelE/ParE family toxin [Deltaproteobacteria bacterium]|nr:type II toxin-antitoxin system RelE/ParE family toxin [Deltaproteobacteria bacterium]